MERASLVPVTPAQLAALKADLVAVGERLEAAECRDWVTVARAAALIDGLRFSLVEVGYETH